MRMTGGTVSMPSFKSDLSLSLSDQVHEAKFSRFPGGHVQRAGNPPCKVRTLSWRGEGDAVLRWYVEHMKHT